MIEDALSSENRLEYFLNNCTEVHGRGRDFWPVFNFMGNMCDDTWRHRNAVLKLLRKHARTRASFASKEENASYEALPEKITVYRGCSKDRQRGLSWTTDRKVAASFTKGHRRIEVPLPVILECVVPKSIVLTTFASRNESEVVLDYLRLPRVLNQIPIASV